MDSGNISKKEKLNIKSKVDLKDLKSIFILKKVLSYMKKNKSLTIIKYNKTLQKKLNLNINDYKECYKEYLQIEIELTLDDNGNNKDNNFINIPEKDKEYFHIYFKKENIIKIIIDYQIKSFCGLFSRCEHINSIFFKKFKIFI